MLLAFGMLAPAIVFADDDDRGRGQRRHELRFDIAENGSRFACDTEPVDEDGPPEYGGEFITEGDLYPHGFLDGRDGVLPSGEPAFPDEVLGRWNCRGCHVGEGARTKSGPWVIINRMCPARPSAWRGFVRDRHVPASKPQPASDSLQG